MATASVETSHFAYLEEVRQATSRLLLLDYDGTLAPFHLDRMQAKPYPGIVPLLYQIASECDTRVVIVSGRNANEIVPLLGISPAPEIWGCHGLERITMSGQYERCAIPDEAQHALRAAEGILKAEGLGHLVEVKLGAVAVHWRGAAPKRREEIRATAYKTLRPLACQGGLSISEFDGGVEMRVRTFNKGDAVRVIVSECEKDVAIAYLGDDTTDEDAFRALNGRGITVLVRPTYRFTAARVWLQPPSEVRDFLRGWIRACGGRA